MKKIFVLISMFICLTITNVDLSASSFLFKIDTTSKSTALSSVVKLFAEISTIDNYTDDYVDEAYKLYLFVNDLNESSNWTSSSIINTALTRGIEISTYTETDLYTSVSIVKSYQYWNTRNFYEGDPDDFDENEVSKYKNYLGLQAFNQQHEKFNFIITTTRTVRDSEYDYIVGYAIGFRTVTQTFTYGEFTRCFGCNQTKYGYYEGYNPIRTINYESTGLNNEIVIDMYDDDKIHLKSIISDDLCEVFMTKDQHYNRNQYNNYDELTAKEYISSFWISKVNAYFHRIGLFTGDTSNLNNVKCIASSESLKNEFDVYYKYPYSSFEIIVVGEVKESCDPEVDYVIKNDPLIRGTFNFVSDTKFHYVYDVIPYFIWGNANNDVSTLKERLIWDYASRLSILDQNYKLKRYDDLYAYWDDKRDEEWNLKISEEDYNELINVLNNNY